MCWRFAEYPKQLKKPSKEKLNKKLVAVVKIHECRMNKSIFGRLQERLLIQPASYALSINNPVPIAALVANSSQRLL